MKSCIGVKMTGNTGTSDQMKTLSQKRRLLATIQKLSFAVFWPWVSLFGGFVCFWAPPGRAGSQNRELS